MRRRVRASIAGSLLCVGIAGQAAAELPAGVLPEDVDRHQLDRQDLASMHGASPHAWQLFRKGEAQLAQGQLRQAVESFNEACKGAPTSALAARRHCQVLTELEEREAATTACLRARQLSHTVMDERAMVGAILTGPKPSTVDQLASAIRLTQLAKRVPEQPFGDAALCEVAYRLGEQGMLQHCVENLQRIAPAHFETRRWAAALRPPVAWPYWLGWGALGCLTLGTAIHAWLRRSRLTKDSPALLGAGLP